MKTDLSYLIDVLKERYEYEQFRRNNFDNVISLPITILVLLIGGLAAVVTQDELSNSIVRFGILAGMLPIGISIYHLTHVFYGANRDYDVLPQAKEINEHYEKLYKYHQDINSDEALNDPSAQTHISFQQDLIKWYSECSRMNCIINDKRMNHFQKSKKWLIISVIVIFILLSIKIIFKL